MESPSKEERYKHASLAKEIYRLHNFLLEERNIPLLKEIIKEALCFVDGNSKGRSVLELALTRGLGKLEHRQEVLYHLNICTVKVIDNDTAVFTAKGEELSLYQGPAIYVYKDAENPNDFTLSTNYPEGTAFSGYLLDEPWDKNLLNCSDHAFYQCTDW